MPTWRGSFQRSAAGGFVHGITHDRNVGNQHTFGFGIGITPIFVDIGNHVKPPHEIWQTFNPDTNTVEWYLDPRGLNLNYIYEDQSEGSIWDRTLKCYRALLAAIQSADWNSQRMARPVPRIVLTHTNTNRRGGIKNYTNAKNPSPGLNIPGAVIGYDPPPADRTTPPDLLLGLPPTGFTEAKEWTPPTVLRDLPEGQAVVEIDRGFRAAIAQRAWSTMFDGFAWQNLNEIDAGLPRFQTWTVIQHNDNRFFDASFDLYHAESSHIPGREVGLENIYGVGGGLQQIIALATQARGLPAPTNACTGCNFTLSAPFGSPMGDTQGWLGHVNGFLSQLLARGGFPTPPECSP